eukprot:15432818-Alexandrium_andersonii.AAC.1
MILPLARSRRTIRAASSAKISFSEGADALGPRALVRALLRFWQARPRSLLLLSSRPRPQFESAANGEYG